MAEDSSWTWSSRIPHAQEPVSALRQGSGTDAQEKAPCEASSHPNGGAPVKPCSCSDAGELHPRWSPSIDDYMDEANPWTRSNPEEALTQFTCFIRPRRRATAVAHGEQHKHHGLRLRY